MTRRAQWVVMSLAMGAVAGSGLALVLLRVLG